MKHTLKKTNLNCAIDKALIELGLDRQRQKIQEIAFGVFQDKLADFKRVHNLIVPQSLLLRGKSISQNEYPLGGDERYQYFRTFCHDLRLGVSNTLKLKAGKQPKSAPNKWNQKFSIIQVYIKNYKKKRLNRSLDTTHISIPDTEKDLSKQDDQNLEKDDEVKIDQSGNFSIQQMFEFKFIDD